MGAPLAEVAPVPSEPLHPVVEAVDDEEVVVRVHGDPRGPVQLPVARAGHAPRGLEDAVLVEDGYPVEPLVGDVDVLLAVQGDAGGPYDFAVAVAVLAELELELLFTGRGADLADADLGSRRGLVPGDVGDVLAGAVQRIDRILAGHGQRHGTAYVPPSHNVAEVVGPAGYCLCKHFLSCRGIYHRLVE